ncbi:MAG: Dihydrodipicolinate reductase [Gemmatimonadetes bacterium]|nr:Dihydrodipicolinate reductase [Gemmatimonadota bacterium]
MTRLAIVGMGKMGEAIRTLAVSKGFQVVAQVDTGWDFSRDILNGAEVAVEFTVPSAAAENVKALVGAGCAVVCGTTGWYDARPAVEQYVKEQGGALLVASNFSVGVNLLEQLVEQAGRLFANAPGFDAHIVETHHTAKKDAPSGTAITLERAVARGIGHSVPISSVRVGSVPGIHELVFDAPFETVRITHDARDRKVFAEGALVAARWLVGRKGIFTMRDVIALPGTET